MSEILPIVQRAEKGTTGGFARRLYASAQADRTMEFRGPGGGQQEGEEAKQASHTPGDPKGSADFWVNHF